MRRVVRSASEAIMFTFAIRHTTLTVNSDPSAGQLIFYGPFAVGGVLSPESNVNFDKSLRERDTAWGVRDTSEVARVAHAMSLQLTEVVDVPANNKMLVFSKI